jgi:hypothetical protein
MMHPNEEALNAYADGSLAATEAADVEGHLASCVSCRQLVDDLRELLSATARLDSREPPVRVWPRVERAIRLEQEHAAAGPQDGAARGLEDAAGRLQPTDRHPSALTAAEQGARTGHYATWLAAAAALVLATVIGLRYAPERRTASTSAPRSGVESSAQAASTASAQSVESELRQAEAHYENAIKGLEQIANSEQNALDPRTAATLQKNLAVIDQAINESRAAVRSQPASEPAQQSLIENFKTKIALLQDTVALINEMRKGNEAGAARIVSGLKQKGN